MRGNAGLGRVRAARWFAVLMGVAYAAVILSFVGALHWGFAMKTPGFDERDRWTWMGWCAPPPTRCCLVGGGPLRF